MKICHLNASLAALLALAAGSCVDKDYNLDDIDTTSQFKVNNLIVPVNIDEIKLSSIIDIEENGDIQVIDGQYAYVNAGDFNTTSISIPEVVIKSADINPVHVALTLPRELQGISGGIKLPEFPVNIPEETTDYNFSASNITEDICDLTRVDGEFDVDLTVSVLGLESIAETFSLEGLQIQLPEGIEFVPEEGSYDASSGILTLTSTMSSASLNIRGKVSALNIPAGAFDADGHSLSISGKVGVTGGNIKVQPRSDWSIPSHTSLSVEFKFGDIHVNAIDGEIQHSIDNVKIPDIDISGLPDILAQEGTNIILEDPKLFLDLENPLYTTGIEARTGLEVTALHGTQTDVYSIDNKYLTIAPNPADYLLLAPYQSGDSRYTFVPFTDLRNILSGDGIPDKLEVELTNPNLPRQRVNGFPIGYNFGEITGTYRFEAPLQFGADTYIKYTDTNDGWSDEDIENITIERLEVSMTVSTDVPVAIELTGHPLNSKGQQIQNVTVTPLHIDANAKDQKVTLAINGVIKDLDGITFTATAYSEGEAAALSPDMNISIKDLRPCVSGYYEKEL